jgi:hypothetical protein
MPCILQTERHASLVNCGVLPLEGLAGESDHFRTPPSRAGFIRRAVSILQRVVPFRLERHGMVGSATSGDGLIKDVCIVRNITALHHFRWSPAASRHGKTGA